MHYNCMWLKVVGQQSVQSCTAQCARLMLERPGSRVRPPAARRGPSRRACWRRGGWQGRPRQQRHSRRSGGAQQGAGASGRRAERGAPAQRARTRKTLGVRASRGACMLALALRAARHRRGVAGPCRSFASAPEAAPTRPTSATVEGQGVARPWRVRPVRPPRALAGTAHALRCPPRPLVSAPSAQLGRGGAWPATAPC